MYRRVQKESDGLLYTVWSLVMVRDQLPAQVVKGKLIEKEDQKLGSSIFFTKIFSTGLTL